jgi:hypothetical protein
LNQLTLSLTGYVRLLVTAAICHVKQQLAHPAPEHRFISKGGLGNFRAERHFLGDDRYSWMFTEGDPLIHLRPDPAAELGPSFGLVDEGCDAFDGFIEDLGTDSTLRGRSAHKP